MPISIELAKKAAQAAATEMHKRKLEMTIAVIDFGSILVYLERANQAGIGTIEAAIGKAKAANGIKVSTKGLEDMSRSPSAPRRLACAWPSVRVRATSCASS